LVGGQHCGTSSIIMCYCYRNCMARARKLLSKGSYNTVGRTLLNPVGGPGQCIVAHCVQLILKVGYLILKCGHLVRQILKCPDLVKELSKLDVDVSKPEFVSGI